MKVQDRVAKGTLLAVSLHHEEIYNLGTWLLVSGVCFR